MRYVQILHQALYNPTSAPYLLPPIFLPRSSQLLAVTATLCHVSSLFTSSCDPSSGTTPSPHHLPPLIALPKCYSVFETQHRHHLLKRLCQISFTPAWDRGLHLAPTALSCYTHSDSHLILSLSPDSSSKVRALFYSFPHPQMLVRGLHLAPTALSCYTHSKKHKNSINI